ncbi:YeaC family protein [Pleionea litopenaei]|uniref:DUF1315 family protein n=1 Tax=Pleionea litopenaei TaxID=3070815 RepID=A0AA51RUW4_9GAMM|nr:DUF1315 family protein [Pleionea sp. HL-JVS1]WMS88020.1 DUF1315 family protein [Pleionea sp. HL-JVS1]
MDIEQLLKAMTPEVYQNLKTAVELGKWADGTRLTEQQMDSAIQAIMIYDAEHHGDLDEPFRIRHDGTLRLGKSGATETLVNSQNIIMQNPVSDNKDEPTKH